MKTWIVIVCPACRDLFRVRLRSRGRRVACPYCKVAIRVPANSDDSVMIDPGSATDWQWECKAVTLALSNLLRAAGYQVTGATLVELISQIPRSEHELATIPTWTLFCRCVTKVMQDMAWFESPKGQEFCQVVRRVAGMDPARRALLEASVVGALDGIA